MVHYFSDFSDVADVLRYKAAKGLKNDEVLSVPVDATVQGTADFLADHNIGVALIRDTRDQIIGVISSRDIVRLIAENGLSPLENVSIATALSRDLTTCNSNDRLPDVAVTMSQNHLHHMPVIDEDGQCIGIISASDMLLFAGEG